MSRPASRTWSMTVWTRASSMLPTVESGPLPTRPSSVCLAIEKSASSGLYTQKSAYCSTASTMIAFARSGDAE